MIYNYIESWRLFQLSFFYGPKCQTMDYFNSSGKKKLLTHNMWLLLFANILLYSSVYILIPVFPQWLIADWGIAKPQAYFVTALYAAAMFLPGAFNSYLVDKFRRQSVSRISMLVMGALALLYPYITFFSGILFLRLGQGICFATAVMATGSTLVIDVTTSCRRTPANVIYTWAARLGMLIGVASAFLLEPVIGMDMFLYISAALSLVSIILVSLVEVCFRAPLGMPLLSLDRFLLPRTFLPALNMLMIPFILGVLVGHKYDGFFYICMAVGWLVYVLVRSFLLGWFTPRIAMLVGVIFIVAGLLLLQHTSAADLYFRLIAAFLIGFGSGSPLSHFLLMMVKLPLHCERGTAYHTYELFFEVGMMAGFVCSVCYIGNVYALLMIVALAGLLLYEFYTIPYFLKKMRSR